MDGLLSIVAGWSAGYQFILFLGLGFAALLAVVRLADKLCVLCRGYPVPVPPPSITSVGEDRIGREWHGRSNHSSRRRSHSHSTFLRLFKPEEGA